MIITLNNKEVEIDDDCVEMVQFFNEQGYPTLFCCSGHGTQEFYIMFSEAVTDDRILEFISKYQDEWGKNSFFGHFRKWARNCRCIPTMNWIYSVSTIEKAVHDIHIFKTHNQDQCQTGEVV